MLEWGLWFLIASLGGYFGWTYESKKEKHARCLENTANLELINRCLDARNAQSQMKSPPWDEPTR